MWRQTQLARRTASLCRLKASPNLNSLQNPSPSTSQVLLRSRYPIESLPSHQLSPHSRKWGFRKSASFQQLSPFSSDSVTEHVQDSDLPSDLNLDQNPDVDSSKSEVNEGGSAESLELVGDDEGGVGENEIAVEADEEIVVGNYEEIVENDVEKVENLLSLLQSSVGNEEEFRGSLDEVGLSLSEKFVLSVLGTPHVPAENFVAFYGWCLGRRGFSVTKQTLDVLVRAVCTERNKYSAFKLWNLLQRVGKKKGELTTEILNDLIFLFSGITERSAAYEVFGKFEEFGCVQDAGTFYYTIQALCKTLLFDDAASVSQKMVTMEMLPDDEKIGKLIQYLSKGKKSREAHSVYFLAKEKNKCPPEHSVNLLITSLCFLPKKDMTAGKDDAADKLYRENIYLALDMLDSLSDVDRKSADTQSFSSVCQALCKIGDVDKAKELLYSMIKSGPPPGFAIFSAIINGLSKAGELDEAMKMLKVIEERGLKPDVNDYNAIMSGYAKGGAMVEAHQVLEEAKQRHAKLTPFTYDTMIRGYCNLEQFDEAVKLMAEMKDYGVQTSTALYNMLFESICVNGLNWEMAERLQGEMKKKGLRLNGYTKVLIRAVKELEGEGKETQDTGM